MNGEQERSEVDTDAELDNAETRADDESSEPVEAVGGQDDLQAKVDENWNLYLRAVAEAENTRKRAIRDVEHARKYALESFGRDVLAIVDSLELGLSAAVEADAEAGIKALLEGSEATLKLLTATLDRYGIAVVDPVGEPFDPELHQAISMQPSGTAEPGAVLQVIQKGYSLNGRLLRPACVIVAAEPA